jgi:hypothetical protein
MDLHFASKLPTWEHDEAYLLTNSSSSIILLYQANVQRRPVLQDSLPVQEGIVLHKS